MASAWLVAGDFVEFSVWEIYLIALAVSGPGILLSLPVLWLGTGERRRAVHVATLVWLFVLPWGVPWMVDALTPGILGRRHAYGLVEYVLRVYVPGTVALPVLAAAWRALSGMWADNRLLAALRSLLYGALFLGAWAWLALQMRGLDSLLGLPLPPGARVAGVVLMPLGGVGAVGCASTFVVAGRGTPAPFDPPREFVAVGPYRWVRNPMYIAGVVLLLGFGLWHRSVAMSLFAGVFGVAAHLFVVFWEEPHLVDRFGETYLAYRRRVNRWIPRPPE